MNCPFCELNEKRNRIIESKKYSFVTPSNPRLMPGHLLVIPKRHVEKPSELNEQEKKEIFETIIQYQKKLLNKSSGCDIRQNYKPFLKQDDLKVNHLHFHLLPREFEDELFKKSQFSERSMFKMMSKEEIEESLKIFKDE